MIRQAAFVLLIALGGSPALAVNDPPRLVEVRAGPLSSALQNFARANRLELLFKREQVGGYRSPPVKGLMTVEAALTQLLRHTNLAARRLRSGAWTIDVRPNPLPEAEAVEAPEILVVGKRTQNVDIRRREDDVQPYRVWSAEQIAHSHRDNLDQFFQSRVSQNTQVLPPTLLDNGETISEIDLRGLGSDATLVLIDGRRMPSIPSATNPYASRQSDLNALPLHAIDRVETLTGTAGGIHGFGALGGVVNIILRRDHRGAEFHGTTGFTSRGDARRLALEGRFGFTPDDGRTDVMLYVAHSRSQPLFSNQRDYVLRDRREFYTGDPRSYEVLQRSRGYGNSIGVYNAFVGQDLVFRSELGGSPLGEDRTFLPVGLTGSSAEIASALIRNAGQVDLSLSEPEAATQLGSNPVTTAAILNLRRTFSPDLEGFFDVLVLRNRGNHRGELPFARTLHLARGSPFNPFTDPILVTFPVADQTRARRSTFSASRYTAGVLASLPSRWRATAEITFGSAVHRSNSDDREFIIDNQSSTLDPFQAWEDFIRSATASDALGFERRSARSRYSEQSLRLSGPVAEIAETPVTLTLLAERRNEKFPGYTSELKFVQSSTSARFETAAREARTTSFYGEMRAPLTGPSAGIVPLRNLELQLAVRREAFRADFSKSARGFEPFEPGERQSASFQAASYTLGAKITPVKGLMLRASHATGRQPPPLEKLVDGEMFDAPPNFDPKRVEKIDDEEPLIVRKFGGSPDLDLVRAATTSVGVVVTPGGSGGPRLSLDFSHVRRTGDPEILNDLLVLLHEDDWPERVLREPLTEADRALGNTGGRIVMLDARAINGGRRSVRTIDVSAEFPARIFGGEIRAYAAATYQLRNVTGGRFEPAIERLGYANGPLRLRGNGGFDWKAGSTSLGLNLQYFGKYRVNFPEPFSTDREQVQGSRWVRAQSYLDLYASRRLRLRGPAAREMTIDLGVVNLLDKPPPRQTGLLDNGPGYSRYGDPRRRRFEITLSSFF